MMGSSGGDRVHCIVVAGKTGSFREFIENSLSPLSSDIAFLDTDSSFSGVLQTLEPDIILVPVLCGRKPGKEVSEAFRKAVQRIGYIPVVALIEEGCGLDEDALFEIGFDRCIFLPLSQAEFQMKIKSMLRLKMRLDRVRTSDRERMLRESRDRIREVYRDVILAVTQNKLRLILGEEELPFTEDMTLEKTLTVRSVDDLSEAKSFLETFLYEAGVCRSRVFDLVVSLSEAVSNVLKHAQTGTVRVYRTGSILQVWVQDNGLGIRFSDLPRSALQRGHSSKNSLGMGFCIMTELMDMVYLFTDSRGTLVILEADLSRDENNALERLSRLMGDVPAV